MPGATPIRSSARPGLVTFAGIPLLLLLVACAGPPASQGTGADGADLPDVSGAEQPSIRGTITAGDDGSIRVEEVPSDDSGSAKALVRFGPATPVRFTDGAPATVADLQVGALVSVWFTGPVAESYPVQATAGAIRIDAGAGSGRP